MKFDGYRDPLVAGLLAAFPGSGHLYVGRPVRGLAYLMGTLVGLFLFVVPGVVIWIASVGDATLCAQRRNATAPPLRLAESGVDIASPALLATDDLAPAREPAIERTSGWPDSSSIPPF